STIVSVDNCNSFDTTPSRLRAVSASSWMLRGIFLMKRYSTSTQDSLSLAGTLVGNAVKHLNKLLSPLVNFRSFIPERFFIGCNLNSKLTPEAFQYDSSLMFATIAK